MKRNRSVLVAGDDQETLRRLKCILTREGYSIAITTDGKSAVALLEECEPDLIILDINPDSFQVLNLIRQCSNVPLIMLTASYEVTTLCRALVLGADDCVRKPFYTGEFLARVRAKLRRTIPEARPSTSLTPPGLGMAVKKE